MYTREGSGGDRVGQGCGEVQVPVALALTPRNQVGHGVSVGWPRGLISTYFVPSTLAREPGILRTGLW